MYSFRHDAARCSKIRPRPSAHSILRKSLSLRLREQTLPRPDRSTPKTSTFLYPITLYYILLHFLGCASPASRIVLIVFCHLLSLSDRIADPPVIGSRPFFECGDSSPLSFESRGFDLNGQAASLITNARARTGLPRQENSCQTIRLL